MPAPITSNTKYPGIPPLKILGPDGFWLGIGYQVLNAATLGTFLAAFVYTADPANPDAFYALSSDLNNVPDDSGGGFSVPLADLLNAAALPVPAGIPPVGTNTGTVAGPWTQNMAALWLAGFSASPGAVLIAEEDISKAFVNPQLNMIGKFQLLVNGIYAPTVAIDMPMLLDGTLGKFGSMTLGTAENVVVGFTPSAVQP